MPDNRLLLVCQRCQNKFIQTNVIKIKTWGGGEWVALVCNDCCAKAQNLFKQFMQSE